MPSRGDIRRAPAVVSLSRERAEWFRERAGTPSYGSAPVEGPGVGALIAAIEAAREAAGASPGPVVLMLGEGLVARDLLKLPPLARGELDAVLSRKAAHALEARVDDVALHAFAPNKSAIPGHAQGDPWLLTSFRRSELGTLCRKLRQHRMPVRRVVDGRLSALAAAHAKLKDPRSTAILIGIEPHAITLTLCRGEAVLNQDTIAGNVQENPAIVPSLIHQVKSLLGFWKKESRGEAVAEIVLFGLHPDHGVLLQRAFETALSDVRVSHAPDAGSHELEGRFEYLRAAAVPGPFNPDLSLPLPPSRTRLAAAFAVSLVLVGATGFGATRHLRERTRTLTTEARRLSRPLQQFPVLLAERRRLEQALATLALRTERLEALQRRGIDAKGLFATVLDAMRGRASFLDLDVRTDPEGITSAVISGTLGAEPVTVFSNLNQVMRTLQRSGYFSALELVLPQELPASDPGAQLEFQIEAELDEVPR